MVQVARTPVGAGGRPTGPAAYAAWAAQLLRDEDFAGDEAVLRQRHEVHRAAVGMVAEARWYGAQFLIQAADDILPFGMTESLLQAAACYAAEHALMWRLWDLEGGNGNPEAYRRMADPAVRRRMVPIIQQAQEKSAQAAGHIAQALTTC